MKEQKDCEKFLRLYSRFVGNFKQPKDMRTDLTPEISFRYLNGFFLIPTNEAVDAVISNDEMNYLLTDQVLKKVLQT